MGNDISLPGCTRWYSLASQSCAYYFHQNVVIISFDYARIMHNGSGQFAASWAYAAVALTIHNGWTTDYRTRWTSEKVKGRQCTTCNAKWHHALDEGISHWHDWRIETGAVSRLCEEGRGTDRVRRPTLLSFFIMSQGHCTSRKTFGSDRWIATSNPVWNTFYLSPNCLWAACASLAKHHPIVQKRASNQTSSFHFITPLEAKYFGLRGGRCSHTKFKRFLLT